MASLNRRNFIFSSLALSASSVAVSKGFARANSLLEQMPGIADLALLPREKLLFDSGWKFKFGHGTDPARDLGFGVSQDDFSKAGDFEFAMEKFDDSTWKSLNLPHDWAVELPFVWDESLKSHGYKPIGRSYPETSVGWYRRSFEIPAADFGKRVVLQFDGAFRSALIFVNGYFIGRNDNGYAPFSFDLSDILHYGGTNYIVVRMDAAFGDGWFYEGAGIYRHVWLVKQDKLHLGNWESYVRSNVHGHSAMLSLGTVVQNSGKNTENAQVRWQIFDEAGKEVAAVRAPAQTLAADGSAVFESQVNLSHPAMWSPETPHLYSAVVTVESNGKTRDAEQVRFGVRTIRFDVDKGFFLNEAPLKVKGTCNHQDHAGVGTALPDRLQYFRLAVLKQMGSNAVRTSHNMPTPEWVEACDRMGMMMMCETRQMSSSQEARAQLEVMIKRYRNSPSIILWSMGNEEGHLQKSDTGELVMQEMIRFSHELDPTRLCTAAVNGDYVVGISKVLDVEGFNYNLNAPDEYHKSHPHQPLIGSETASAVSTRGIYTTDKLRNWVSAYDVNQPGWGELAEQWWKFYAAREWLAGGFAWTGFDYRGEPTPYGWPSISSQFGIVDTCGFPKDTFYYYKAWWGQEPVLHLFPHWDWAGKEGETISVWVHSNLDSVELFLNGKSLGSQNIAPLSHLEWNVKYQPGVLEARGKRNGKVVMIEKRETTGGPHAIRLTSDRDTIDADGEDIAVIRVEMLDDQGRPVATADDMIHFDISGAGTLLGVGNGDPNCHESDKEPTRSLFNGLAQIVVQSKNPGVILVEASAPKGKIKILPAKLTIQARQVKLRPSL